MPKNQGAPLNDNQNNAALVKFEVNIVYLLGIFGSWLLLTKKLNQYSAPLCKISAPMIKKCGNESKIKYNFHFFFTSSQISTCFDGDPCSRLARYTGQQLVGPSVGP